MPNVLGVKIYGCDIHTAVFSFLKDIKSSVTKKGRLVSATGVHGIVTAQRSVEFKRILEEFYCNLPDGMPLVWLGRLKGAEKMKRCPGPYFFEQMMKQSATEPVKHFFCGGKEGVAEQLKLAVNKKFNNDNVSGTFCPPFRAMSTGEMEDLGQLINQASANIIWIGLGTPKQEKFAYRLRDYVTADYIITVGAAFDFHTDRLKMAPHWMQVSGLEWLFRLSIEPRRLYRRYLLIIPLFFYYNIKSLLSRHPKPDYANEKLH